MVRFLSVQEPNTMQGLHVMFVSLLPCSLSSLLVVYGIVHTPIVYGIVHTSIVYGIVHTSLHCLLCTDQSTPLFTACCVRNSPHPYCVRNSPHLYCVRNSPHLSSLLVVYGSVHTSLHCLLCTDQSTPLLCTE